MEEINEFLGDNGDSDGAIKVFSTQAVEELQSHVSEGPDSLAKEKKKSTATVTSASVIDKPASAVIDLTTVESSKRLPNPTMTLKIGTIPKASVATPLPASRVQVAKPTYIITTPLKVMIRPSKPAYPTLSTLNTYLMPPADEKGELKEILRFKKSFKTIPNLSTSKPGNSRI